MEPYHVVLEPHNPDWAALYEQEAARLLAAWGSHILEIHHAGSTAIPGIKAKAILDFCVVVEDIDYIDAHMQTMTDLGYLAMGENGVPGRRFFRRYAGEVRTHHLHMFAPGHPEIARMLDFRDYLRAHPEEAQAYELLKEELAKQFPYDVVAYAKGKSEFVEEILRKARE